MEGPLKSPIFFRITVGLFGVLLFAGAALIVVLVLNAEQINRDGGFAWLLAAAGFIAAATVVCACTAVTSVLSLRRREAHRRLTIAFLIVSALVLLTFGSAVARAAVNLVGQYQGSRR